jgi:PelA/Pel-15E family pectate lyase
MNTRSTIALHLIAVLALLCTCILTPKVQAAAMTVREALHQSDTWFRSDEGRTALDNVLSHQSLHGGWPKNQNSTAKSFSGERKSIKGTFDNGATTGELRLLARALAVTNDVRYHTAFLKGFDHILAAQYTNGGWPQYSPPPAKSYHRHITFNDDSMRRLLEFLRDVASATNFAFVPADKREAAMLSFNRGIDCILKCQVRVDGRLTVWCAQHDEITLEPRPARTYELASLSGSESAGLLLLLMSLEQPSPAVIRAVHAGAQWYQTNKLNGIREMKADGDKKIVRDATAPALWARFYEIDTGRPIFSGRDGVRKYDYVEIEKERRKGYSWYGTRGTEVLAHYESWRQRWPEAPSARSAESPSSK